MSQALVWIGDCGTFQLQNCFIFAAIRRMNSVEARQIGNNRQKKAYLENESQWHQPYALRQVTISPFSAEKRKPGNICLQKIKANQFGKISLLAKIFIFLVRLVFPFCIFTIHVENHYGCFPLEEQKETKVEAEKVLAAWFMAWDAEEHRSLSLPRVCQRPIGCFKQCL